MQDSELLFIGTHGHVRAVDKRTGEDVWTTSLPSTGYQIVTLLFEDEVLFAASHGRLFALSPADGTILWNNKLKGMGLGHVCLATAKTAAPTRAELLAAAAAADAAAAASS